MTSQPDNTNDGGGDEDVDGGGADPDAATGQAGNQFKERLNKNRTNRRLLSKTPQDFQIRVRIIEGKHLPGNNIKPMVKVHVCGQTHRTRTKTGNNPFFNELFYINVNKIPSELFDEDLIITVYNSVSLRADSFIGEFKIDVGYVYEEPGHACMRKWLVLNDPEDTSSSGKGYLRASLFVVETGDEPPVEHIAADEDQEDIESNLLLPAGVTMQYITFTLKVFRAEDIPQMDDTLLQSVKKIFGGASDKKKLVDPFVEVFFAGKKICSKVIEKNCNPVWNQAFNLQIKFPSVSDRIKLTVYDWDRLNKNDIVGTAFLSLSKIASSGGEVEGESEMGFLPAFGPCYINLYGSPREFTGLLDPFEQLNLGKAEGVAYRGRVLIELTTQIDAKAEQQIEDIPSSNILVAEKYQQRCKYSLCTVFHAATMLQEGVEPIQFEVSMGNYGNKFDNTCKQLPSTTQYTSPVFDGNMYYYLPWSNFKPVVVLTSFWEDIGQRLHAVNIIINIADRLQSNICVLKTAIVSKDSETHIRELWLMLITQLIEDIDNDLLPDLNEKLGVTVLDIHMKKMRVCALQSIKDSANQMREEATDVKATMTDIEDWQDRLQQLADEPQNSLPDVIIWMLRGEKRLAYARIPANQILYSATSEKASGKYCGKIQNIFMKYPMDKNKGLHLPLQLRVNMWLGLSAEESEFRKFTDGTFSVFAEIYENQALVFGKWGTTGLLGRHKYSDLTGKIKLKRESFLPPKGWEWEGDWFVESQRNLQTAIDPSSLEYIDEVYENETRLPGEEWQTADEQYTDVNGKKALAPHQHQCPPGWKWEDNWNFVVNETVDQNGWEYGISITPESKATSWMPAEKKHHTHRRKRLIRKRKQIEQTLSTEKPTLEKAEGWEYASLIGWKFHNKRRISDTFRHRRWRRKMILPDKNDASAIFRLEGTVGTEISEDDLEGNEIAQEISTSVFGAATPRISCIFERPFLYHLRVYVYQARNLMALDKGSFSDPYAHVSFLHRSKTTEIINKTLNPTWDQTLIFDDIDIYGNPEDLAQNPPNIVFELFDSDIIGKDEPLGRTVCLPLVKLTPEADATPKLLWYPVIRAEKKRGEVLVAAELILKDKPDGSNLPIIPPKRAAKVFMVPQGIRPVVQLTAIEILPWGLRNMKSFQLAAVSSPSLIVECGGEIAQTAVIKNMKKNPNFLGCVLFMKVLLPKEEIYTPPMVIKVIDHRQFGRKPIVGQCTIDSLEEYRCDPYAARAEDTKSVKGTIQTTDPGDFVIDIENEKPLLDTQERDSVDWWSKFYASIGEHDKCGEYLQKGYDTLKVFDDKLEDIPDYEGLTDFCHTFKLYRGKADDDEEYPAVVGEFKGSFSIYSLSDDPNVPEPPRQFRELPESGPQECLVRIYIIRGIDLQPKDSNGLCDPYIKIIWGKKVIEDRDHYIPNTLNPLFGRMFELTCIIPQDKDLKIAVFDYDLMSRDDEVGNTVIDLENRLLSHFGAHCGLPQSYCVSGVNQWRDQLRPSQILQNLAHLKGFSPPAVYDSGKSLSYDGRDYTLEEFEAGKIIHDHLGPPHERLALHVLRTQVLIPEHVETRTLYSTFQQSLSQGKLQMWVDIFPKSLGTPGPPFDISPRKPKKYILRVIIWNTSDVILEETSITGEKMSDIYVKGWMPGMEGNKQRTDVHYRSLDGDGNFNWRFVFPFEYLPAEQLCSISRKDHFWSLDKTEFRVPPQILIQLWDNDKFSLDDCLGTLLMDLRHLIVPAKSSKTCDLKMILEDKGNVSEKQNSLFYQKCVRGWWPCLRDDNGSHVLAGKVEMTLEILTEEEAEERPAGKARDEPNMNPKLDPPNRPDTSFLWFTNPCKIMKLMLRRFRCFVIGVSLLVMLVLFIGILLYSLPNYLSMKIVKPFR
ncbi:myoferlin-like [Polypterus senegalus]|uniref:myoferlin-like n=1 Tax=Polypterus senegalus TaxID=55291 RepID=UPI00196329D5|nr:myoferlin-like [Polypterus senegalus]